MLLRRRHSALPLVISSFLSVFYSAAFAADEDAKTLRFNRDIRPILTDRCFPCHGPDSETLEGGLRLDLREEAVGEDGAAIVPGDSEDSEVVRRILSEDADEVMPPFELHKPLSESEKRLIQQWIDQGAPYEPHWAYTPMRRASEITSQEPSFSSRRIDAIIDERLKSEGVVPAEPADKVTLIRRLSIDLTGIPPTPEEVEAFLSDTSQQAYEDIVDRLLSSQRYGERMAVYWLDLVRYADTVGYHGDQNVSQSPYRDYVIDAFNQNLPYDQFIRHQLAGDLLPNATQQHQIASGYNRLNQTTEEGGAQAKEYLSIYFADRVRNVSQVFMGATVGCAQCHDHKYDPYTMKDFYSLGAFFADLDERGVYGARSRPPMLRVVSEQLQAELDALDLEIEQWQARRPETRKKALKGLAAWEADLVKRLEEETEKETAWVDDARLIGGTTSGDWKFVNKKDAPVHSGSSSRRQSSDGLVQHFFDNAETPYNVGENSRFFAWIYLDPTNPPKSIMLQLNDGDWSHRKVWGSDDIPYGRQPKSHAAYQRGGELPDSGKWIRLEVDASEVGLSDKASVKGMAFTQFGGVAHWDKAGVIEAAGVPADVAKALQTESTDRTTEQTEVVEKYFLAQSPAMVKFEKQLDELKTKRKSTYESAPQTVVSRATKPRTIRILPRGNWMDDSGEIVSPAIPEFLGEVETTAERLTRLDLADWLCRPDNPLTSRTMVNRLWSLMFGRGICESVDDFGGQGTFPSYPGLLDELSLEFVESGWDIKSMLRTIALSEAYRRSSVPSPQHLEQDPYNDLFARQGRFTVDAEVVRDIALATSGLLVEKVGGASVRPYQPEGYYAQLNFPRRKYQPDSGDDQYRRGLYTHWQRTFLHPMLKAFDAPSREECTAKRARSNTPIQALVLLNDPTFVEAARVFAERIMREGGATTETKMDWAYRRAVSRAPQTEIANELSKLYESHLSDFRADPEAAKQLVATGESPVADDLDPASLAAWTNVARVILNLHETINRY